jgi:hypothetical protein
MFLRKYFFILFTVLFITGIKTEYCQETSGSFRQLTKEDLSNGAHHLNHFKTFSKYATGYNSFILKAIDTVQSHILDGGGYYIGLKVNPPESPVYYELKLDGMPLITPPRKSSYCSGSTYTAFIEAINMIMPGISKDLTLQRFEALRMQEPDGARREDWIKFWGIWNADGFGSQFALAQYSKMGVEVKPEDAVSGDFANISWKSGGGHSVIFLGWTADNKGSKSIMYWSSQPGTNGYGDQIVSIDKITEIKFARLTNPQNILNFDINAHIDRKIPGDKINWK